MLGRLNWGPYVMYLEEDVADTELFVTGIITVAVFYLQNNLILQADGMPTEVVFYTITVNSLSIPLQGAVRGSMRPRTHVFRLQKCSLTPLTN